MANNVNSLVVCVLDIEYIRYLYHLRSCLVTHHKYPDSGLFEDVSISMAMRSHQKNYNKNCIPRSFVISQRIRYEIIIVSSIKGWYSTAIIFLIIRLPRHP